MRVSVWCCVRVLLLLLVGAGRAKLHLPSCRRNGDPCQRRRLMMQRRTYLQATLWKNGWLLAGHCVRACACACSCVRACACACLCGLGALSFVLMAADAWCLLLWKAEETRTGCRTRGDPGQDKGNDAAGDGCHLRH